MSETRARGDFATIGFGILIGLACAFVLRMPACITGEQLPPEPRNPWDIPGRLDSDSNRTKDH